MNASLSLALVLTALLCLSAPAAVTGEMTGGVYRIELSTFDNGGAMSTGAVYWQYSAVGQTEGVGSLVELMGSTYAADVGVLPRPIPEPAGLTLAGVLICFRYLLSPGRS